jgi:hypothetical protein
MWGNMILFDVLETALRMYEAYGERLTAAHRHSHTALRIYQHCNRRFGPVRSLVVLAVARATLTPSTRT